MKKISLMFILLFQINLNAESTNNFFLISIPKCGTFLIDKLVALITKKQNICIDFIQKKILTQYSIIPLPYSVLFTSTTPPSDAHQLFKPSLEILDLCTNLKESEYIFSHLTYTKEYEDLFSKKKMKLIFIIRDPRDQLVSRVYYTQSINAKGYPGLSHLSFKELLERFMGMELFMANDPNKRKFDNLLTMFMGCASTPEPGPISNISQFYNLFLPWSSSPICYTTKFENLVGAKGGGSDEIQLAEIQAIANYLECPLSIEETKKIVDALFGNTQTFRDGKIGAWKTHFTKRHKREFKRIAGQLLIDLGYEKDYNW